MRVVIIEDEPLVAKQMAKLVERVNSNLKVVASLGSVRAIKEWMFQNELPNLIFSDIQLSDGISFDVFDELKLNVPVIFTTAYSEYALRAFKLNSIDYLLKPVDENELRLAVTKFLKTENKNTTTDFSVLLTQVFKKNHLDKEYKNRFLVNAGNAIKAIDVNEIAMFSLNNFVLLHTMTSEQFTCNFHSLDEVESVIDPKQFYRVNRQNIIHKAAIDSIKTDYSGKINVQLKRPIRAEIIVSKEKAKEFKIWFGE